jgi:pyruvate, orthophosphate dikinase
MLGHRGCRLGITYPEITEMQARAIFEAAVRAKRRGIDVTPGDHGAARGRPRASSNISAPSSSAAEQVMGAMESMCRTSSAR